MNDKSAMTVRARIETVVLCVAFALYLLFLAKLLIFSRVSHGFGDVERSINLIPLGSIMVYARGGSATVERFAFSNVVGNVIAFSPLGAYLPLFSCGKKTGRNLLLIFAASLLVETIQGVFGIGTADVDDVILNCLGGLIGICGYRLLLLVLRTERRARTAIAILSAIGLPVLLYYLLVVKLIL